MSKSGRRPGSGSRFWAFGVGDSLLPGTAPPETASPKDNPQKLNLQAGFTLTEVMVTILIIGLLSTIVLINVLPNVDRANVTKAKTDVRALEQALEFYRLDMAAYPTAEEGLEALVSAPAGNPRADRYREGGYIRGGLPLDPWGNPYQYVIPGEHGPVDIFSFGADGRPDGDGLDADIGNWS